MSGRIANIGMTHLAGLAGMEHRIRSSFGVTQVEYHDQLIFPAMIQSGVHRFRIFGPSPKSVQESMFLRDKCEEYPLEQYMQIMDSVKATISQHSIQERPTEDNESKLFQLAWFLSELIIALDTKSAMISVLPLPEPSDYVGLLSPEMRFAVINLLDRVEPVSLALPIPQSRVLSGDVRVFQDIISSDVFASYSDAHQSLQTLTEKKQTAVEWIQTQGSKLRKRFSRILSTKSMSISLIPVTASMIDSVCGKFPGSLASVFGEALARVLEDRDRVTIYHYGNVHRELLFDHYESRAAAQREDSQP